MSWHNPLRFFAKTKKPFVEPTIGEIILYCDNQQCRSPITDMELAYNEGSREIYHVGGCFALANDVGGISFGYSYVSRLGHIRAEEALKLFVKKGLRQSEKLEQRVSGYKN